MDRSPFMLAGIIAWVLAAAFGLRSTVQIKGPVVPPAGSNTSVLQDYEVTNLTGAATAFGFSLAGGLCFIGAALVRPEPKRESPPPPA